MQFIHSPKEILHNGKIFFLQPTWTYKSLLFYEKDELTYQKSEKALPEQRKNKEKNRRRKDEEGEKVKKTNKNFQENDLRIKISVMESRKRRSFKAKWREKTIGIYINKGL